MKAHEASEHNRANLDLDYQCLLQSRVSGPVCEYLDLLEKEHWVTCDPVGSPVESIFLYFEGYTATDRLHTRADACGQSAQCEYVHTRVMYMYNHVHQEVESKFTTP